MKLQFKFKEKVPGQERERLAAVLRERGARAVRPLFPDDPDPELATLYLVDCGEDPAGGELRALLAASPAVEFVEPEVRRKLVG